jgi:hypothetical protein
MTLAVFRRSQIAPEATVGTVLPPTHQLSGAMAMKNAPERLRREERRASMGGSTIWTDFSYRAEGQYTGRATAQELPFFLASAIDGTVQPTTGTWTYAQPLYTVPPLKSLCVYVGDNTQALRAAGVYTRQLTIEGRDTGAWMVTADLFGRELVKGTFIVPKATMANDTVKNLMSQVYIDDVAIGAGLISGTAYGFRWVWTSGIEPDYTMSNQLDMTGIHRDEPTCTLEITAKWNAAIVNEFDKYRALSTRYVRLNTSTSGGNSIRIDGVYAPTDFTPLAEERNGTTIATLQLTAVESNSEKVTVACQNTLTAAELPVAAVIP